MADLIGTIVLICLRYHALIRLWPFHLFYASDKLCLRELQLYTMVVVIVEVCAKKCQGVLHN